MYYHLLFSTRVKDGVRFSNTFNAIQKKYVGQTDVSSHVVQHSFLPSFLLLLLLPADIQRSILVLLSSIPFSSSFSPWTVLRSILPLSF